MKKINIHHILIGLIILSGIFFYKGYFPDRFGEAEFSFFIFSVGLLGSYLLYKKNKWMGCLGLIASIGFFRSYAFQQIYSAEFLFKEFLGGSFIFLLYYMIRELNIKEDILKWFLIPAILNILIILVQSFDGNMLNFMPIDPKIAGFLGNKSLTSCFLALTTPIFLRFIPFSFIPLIVISILCESRAPLLALIISSLIYFKHTNIKFYRVVLFSLCLLIGILMIDIVTVGRVNNYLFTPKLTSGFWFKERGCMQVGTIDGIMHNPILGWGVGSFIPIISKIPERETRYCGTHFNQGNYKTGDPNDLSMIMNHPHNEYLYGWWNFGILWLIGLFCLMKDVDRRFKPENILPFSILMGAFVLALGYFFIYPVWFLVVLTLGIYHNQIKEA